MARHTIQYIHLDPANIMTGVWCDRCNTSGASTYDVVTTTDRGVAVVGHGTICTTCEPDD